MNLNEVTYQGMAFPVDYERKVLGELTDREIEKYSEGVNNSKCNNYEGEFNYIFFVGDNTIRYTINKSIFKKGKELEKNICLRNFFIGNHLRNNYIGAPEMKAVYFGDMSDTSFLVMEKLFLKEIYFSDTIERRKIFNQQSRKILSLGYTPRDDTNCNQNFGIDSECESYFFDFDNWYSQTKIPKLNDNGVII